MPEDTTAEKPAHRDRITEAAAVIADWPTLWQDLLRLHVAGADGRCRGCFSAVHPAPRVPCNIAELAAAAATISRARALQVIPAGPNTVPVRAPGGRWPARRG
jgi:hypothetical protein